MDSLVALVRAVYQRLRPGGGTAERSIKSGIWVSLINVLERAIQLGRVVILAAILVPADFGLLGIGLLVLAVLEQFSRLGIDEALIQKEESDVDRYLDTVLWLKIARGATISTIAFLLAPFAAQFFSEPRALDVIRALALVPLLKGFRNPGVVYFQKDLQFHKQFVLRISATAANFLVAVGYGIVQPTVWALVFGTITGAIVGTLISYPIHPYRPGLSLELQEVRDLLGYGKWLTAFSGILFINNQGDDAFVGWFLDSTALGFYQLGYRISNAPATEITHVIGSVLFPTYSELQNDVSALRSAFFQVFNLVSIIAFPMVVGMIVVAPPFVSLLWGAKWEPMIPIIQLLALFALGRALGSTGGPLFKAVGRPDLLTKTAVIDLVVVGILIYPATAKWGLVGTAAVMVLRPIASGAVIYYLILEIVETSWVRLFRTVSVPLLASLIMGSLVYTLRLNWPGESYPKLILLILFGVVSYSVIVLLFEKTIGIGLQEMLGIVKNNV